MPLGVPKLDDVRKPEPEPIPWRERAACRGRDTDQWFADCDGRSKAARQAAREAVEDAKAVCRACPVRADCLAYAMEHEKYGVWGGLDEEERKSERRRRQRREQMARARRAAS